MPNINDLKYNGKNYAIYLACSKCGKERWVQRHSIKRPVLTGLCKSCGCKNAWIGKARKGEEHPHWKGGRIQTSQGYIFIHVSPDDFFAPMRIKLGYVLEHRLVMAKHLGRNLQSWELVHHKHTKYPAGSVEDKQDNRIENLQLVTDTRHNQITILENKIARLQTENKKLKLLLQSY